jgi:alpha,alpha-trehalase
MFPWQSGSDGREETQRLHLNPRSGRWVADRSHLQRHVNAAIAHNVWKYYEVTGDLGFLAAVGAEIILEIARFFASLATRSPERDRYEIRAVMGPDEFHDGYPDREEGGVDDNTYTNVMATWVLCRALDVLERLPEDARAELGLALALGDEEVARWREISRKMRVVFHADGVPSQFDGYERLLELDWDRYRAKYGDIQRLDRILEAEGDTANRYKVSKQADVLMLLYLFSADELRELFGRLGYEFPPEAIPRTVEYYVRRTSHGSTLSRVVGAWVLARSDRARSFELFREALESDISDVQGGTTAEGIHLGAMAGTVDLIQRCYTGLEVRGDVLWLDPKLPAPIARLDLRLRYRDQPLEIRVTRDRLRIASSPSGAGPIRVGFRGKVFELAPCETKELDLAPPAGAPSGASRRASGA